MTSHYKPWPEKTKAAVFSKTAGHCSYCGTELSYATFHIDHDKAQINGGNDDLDNLLPACPSCNPRKQSLTKDEFRNWVTSVLIKTIDNLAARTRANSVYLDDGDVSLILDKLSDIREIIQATPVKFFIDRCE